MDYSVKAIQYAEDRGIIEYTVKGSKMIYYTNYPANLSERKRTYMVTVNLITGKEETRVKLDRWSRKGNDNMYK